ncbi:hypothetical protein ACEQ8H_001012 [Pleosporales sp. CAS-2024a]
MPMSNISLTTTPPQQKMPSIPFGVTAVQQRLHHVALEDAFETPHDTAPPSWMSDCAKTGRLEQLKNMVLGTCRLLYGSERFKFYDIVIGATDDETTFCAALSCNKDGMTKILRTTLHDCPIKATEAMVRQLQKDVMPLLVNFGPGTQLAGQQGYTNHLSGKFELAEEKEKTKPDGAADDTETMKNRGDSWVPSAPKGPKYRGAFKRYRGAEDKMEGVDDGGISVRLNYD